ncbi:hypothetical protein BDW74DRAFT_152619 [Aspergillus multicolor]|uniref:uncharacterized protein n=1 Tax=Aspergillus multicolor TaxID=41759 RepID=UPI003CCDF22D
MVGFPSPRGAVLDSLGALSSSMTLVVSRVVHAWQQAASLHSCPDPGDSCCCQAWLALCTVRRRSICSMVVMWDYINLLAKGFAAAVIRLSLEKTRRIDTLSIESTGGPMERSVWPCYDRVTRAKFLTRE